MKFQSELGNFFASPRIFTETDENLPFNTALDVTWRFFDQSLPDITHRVKSSKFKTRNAADVSFLMHLTLQKYHHFCCKVPNLRLFVLLTTVLLR